MRREENTQRLARVSCRLLLRKMLQSIAPSVVPSFDSGASSVSEALFGRLLQALHHSRRLQAERTLRQYRRLIDIRWHRFAPRSDVGGHGNVAQ